MPQLFEISTSSQFFLYFSFSLIGKYFLLLMMMTGLDKCLNSLCFSWTTWDDIAPHLTWQLRVSKREGKRFLTLRKSANEDEVHFLSGPNKTHCIGKSKMLHPTYVSLLWNIFLSTFYLLTTQFSSYSWNEQGLGQEERFGFFSDSVWHLRRWMNVCMFGRNWIVCKCARQCLRREIWAASSSSLFHWRPSARPGW